MLDNIIPSGLFTMFVRIWTVFLFILNFCSSVKNLCILSIPCWRVKKLSKFKRGKKIEIMHDLLQNEKN